MSWKFALLATAIAFAGCSGDPGAPTDDVRPPSDDVEDEDSTSAAADPCAKPTLSTVAKPVPLMSAEKLAQLGARLPCIKDKSLRRVLEHPDTIFYDKTTMIPGYQDSFGDNTQLPIGMRPNTIDSIMINLAVPGGHGQIFQETGVFHFPFGRPIGVNEQNVAVVNFWRPPRDENGKLMPVAWWWHEPTGYTHRIEWVFPRDTIFGELLFIIGDDGQQYPFEVRLRRRLVDGWGSIVYRPFPTAESLASAIETKRQERPQWAADPQVTALVTHLRNPATLSAATLSSPKFPGAFPTINGYQDSLPAVQDSSLLKALLVETGFASARGKVWKQNGSSRAYAATTSNGFSIVPKGFNGGLVDVSQETCSECHRDAGRPFRAWYENIIAYGELWGQDEIFTWHPFVTGQFVDNQGGVLNFNNDNRRFRQDLVSSGLLEEFDGSKHTPDRYKDIPRDWKNYEY